MRCRARPNRTRSRGALRQDHGIQHAVVTTPCAHRVLPRRSGTAARRLWSCARAAAGPSAQRRASSRSSARVAAQAADTTHCHPSSDGVNQQQARSLRLLLRRSEALAAAATVLSRCRRRARCEESCAAVCVRIHSVRHRLQRGAPRNSSAQPHASCTWRGFRGDLHDAEACLHRC